MVEASNSAEDWAAPSIERVTAGVYRVPLPLPQDGLRAVNVYLLLDGERIILIDSGWPVPECRQPLEKALAELGAAPSDVAICLVTHVHRDHYGQALTLRRELGISVSLGAGEATALQNMNEPDRRPMGSMVSLLRTHGAKDLGDRIEIIARSRTVNAEDWEMPDTWLREGQSIEVTEGRALDVIETPGHTKGHVVFRDATERLLFAGDHVLPQITPSIGFEPALSPNPLGDYLASLAKMRSLPDTMLLPAHGPVRRSVHSRVDELISHHGGRLDSTEAAVLEGADNAFLVAGRLRWTRRERRLDELDDFNQMLAVAETLSHLILLREQGRVTEVTELDGNKHYVGPTSSVPGPHHL